MVHDIRYYAPEDIRFGMRYADAVRRPIPGLVVEEHALIATLLHGKASRSGSRDIPEVRR